TKTSDRTLAQSHKVTKDNPEENHDHADQLAKQSLTSPNPLSTTLTNYINNPNLIIYKAYDMEITQNIKKAINKIQQARQTIKISSPHTWKTMPTPLDLGSQQKDKQKNSTTSQSHEHS
ncbi:14169_t:CDS:2, partial [Acaulospora colombiana]